MRSISCIICSHMPSHATERVTSPALSRICPMLGTSNLSHLEAVPVQECMQVLCCNVGQGRAAMSGLSCESIKP